MPLGFFRAERFRCLVAVEIDLDRKANLFVGPNASGKTSLLEAAFFLSRGRSFRTRRRDVLIARGEETLQVRGTAVGGPTPIPLGVRAGRGETEWHAGGVAASGIAELAELFPAQVIDPEVHKLLEEGPGRRRRFLDWGVFHVEQAFLPAWRRYQLALRQRNAALKQDATDQALGPWEQELAHCGEAIANQRDAYIRATASSLARIGIALLDQPISLRHDRGWDPQRSLADALASDRGRDRRQRATQLGPHRGDVIVHVGERPAKDQISRGQQKLVAAGLLLAQLEAQESARPGRSALLLDDPAAELDAGNLGRLMALIRETRAQLWITSLRPEILDLIGDARVFHVKQGEVRRVSWLLKKYRGF